MDTIFKSSNARSLCRSGSLHVLSRELAKYRVDLLGEQMRRDKRGAESPEKFVFLYGNRNDNHNLVTCFIVIREPCTRLRETGHLNNNQRLLTWHQLMCMTKHRINIIVGEGIYGQKIYSCSRLSS
jgi:hypothetical protein